MTNQTCEMQLFPDPMPRRQAGIPGSVCYSRQTPCRGRQAELSPGIIDFC